MSYEQPVATIGLSQEQEQALYDARNVIRELGLPVLIRLHEEQKITRDKFNSIKKRNIIQTPGITFYAFPVVFNPTIKQLDDAGIKEQTQVLIKTAVQDWIDNGFTVNTLKNINSIRATVIISDAKYEIRDKNLDSQYGDTFLYIHLGLNRI